MVNTLVGIAPEGFTNTDFLDLKVWWQVRALDRALETYTPLRDEAELETLYQPMYHPPSIAGVSIENNYNGEIDITIEDPIPPGDERDISQNREYTCHVVPNIPGALPQYLITPWQSSTSFTDVVTSPAGNTTQLAQVVSRWSSTTPDDVSTLNPQLYQDLEKLVTVKNTEFVTAVRSDQVVINNEVIDGLPFNMIRTNLFNDGTNDFSSVQFGLQINDSGIWHEFDDDDEDGVALATWVIDNVLGNESFNIKIRATTSDNGTTNLLNSYDYYTYATPLSLTEGTLTSNSVTYSINNTNENFPKYYIRYVVLDSSTGNYPTFPEVPPEEDFLSDEPTTVTIQVDGICSDPTILNAAECTGGWTDLNSNSNKNIKVQVIVRNEDGILQETIPEYISVLLPEDMNSGNVFSNNTGSNSHLINIGIENGLAVGNYITTVDYMGLGNNTTPFWFAKYQYDVQAGTFREEVLSTEGRGLLMKMFLATLSF